MQNNRSLTEAQWRKSSYSGGTGGECVECTPIGTATWRRSSYSGDNGGACIEVADLAPHIAVRDSKQATGPHVTFTPAAWADFLAYATQ
ncbi:DUF397 domain-containing protein [Streptomyces shenzhenensis]